MNCLAGGGGGTAMGGGAAAAEEETHGRSTRGQNKRTAESREPSADSPQYARKTVRSPRTLGKLDHGLTL